MNDIAEAAFVHVAHVCQSLMGYEHVLGVLDLVAGPFFAAGGKLGAGHFAFLRPGAACAVHLHDVVQAQIGEKLQVAGVGVQDAERAAVFFAELEGGSCERAQESGVHHGTSFQIHNEIMSAIGDDCLERFFDLDGVLKGAATFNPKPKKLAYSAYKNGGGGSHGKQRKVG